MAPTTQHAECRIRERLVSATSLPSDLEAFRQPLVEAKRLVSRILTDQPINFRHAGNQYRASRDRVAIVVRGVEADCVVGLSDENSAPVIVTAWIKPPAAM